MTVYLFIGGAVIFSVIGMIFIIRGIKISTENQSAVPISDLAEIKQINKSYPASDISRKTKTPDLTRHLVEENQKNSIAADQAKMLESLQSQITRLIDENKRLQGALDRELSSQKLTTVSEDDQRILREKESLYQKAQNSIESLTLENQHLVKNIENLQIESSKWKETISALQDEVREVQQQAVLKVQTLQKTADDFTAQKRELLINIDNLQAENRQSKEAASILEGKIKEIEQQAVLKVQTLQKTVDELKEESNVAFQNKVRMDKLETQKQELEQSLQNLNQQVEQLKGNLSERQNQDTQGQLKSTQELELLKGESEVLQDQKEKLERMLDEAQQKYTSIGQDYEQKISQLTHETSNLKKALQDALDVQEKKAEEISSDSDQKYRADVEELQEEIQRLKNEVEHYLKRPPVVVEKVVEVEKIIEVEKIVEVEKVVEKIVEKKDETIQAQINEINGELNQLMQAKLILESDLKKVREFNSHLIEKEKFLQYELTKYRAHAMGLEKICEDLRLQNEQISRI